MAAGGRSGWRGVAIGAAFLVFGAGLGAHSLRLARTPDFEVGLVRHFRPAILAEGTVLRLPLSSGSVEIRAALLRPGHDRVWGFRMGPSTFLALEGVEASVHREGNLYCTISGGRAELTSEELRITGGPVLSIPGRPSPVCRLVVVDLRSGDVRHR